MCALGYNILTIIVKQLECFVLNEKLLKYFRMETFTSERIHKPNRSRFLLLFFSFLLLPYQILSSCTIQCLLWMMFILIRYFYSNFKSNFIHLWFPFIAIFLPIKSEIIKVKMENEYCFLFSLLFPLFISICLPVGNCDEHFIWNLYV